MICDIICAVATILNFYAWSHLYIAYLHILHFTHIHTTHTPYRVYWGRRTHRRGPGAVHMEGENVHLMSDEDDDGMPIVYDETAPNN